MVFKRPPESLWIHHVVRSAFVSKAEHSREHLLRIEKVFFLVVTQQIRRLSRYWHLSVKPHSTGRRFRYDSNFLSKRHES